MRFIKLIPCILTLLLCQSLSAQKVEKYLFLGKEAEDKRELKIAASIYSEGISKIDGNPELNFRYAECLRQLNDYELAEKYYRQTINCDSTNQFPVALYWLASLQKNNGNYTESLANWELLKRLNENQPTSVVYLKSIQEIKSCLAAINGHFPTYSYPVTNIRFLNSVNAEFASSYYDTVSMVYSKLPPPIKDKKKGEKFIQLNAAIKKNGQWESAGPLPATINVDGYQNANGHFSSDRKFFVFSRCEDNSNCQIYIALYKNGAYSKAYPIKLNVSGYASTQPHLAKTSNGYVLFFSSNRPGGKGGYDLWYSLADDQLNLQPAVNIAALNTPEDEISPFYYEVTHELFFSSTWYSGLGGYDVFRSKTHNFTDYEAPVNIGLPYNSPANDFYFSVAPIGNKGTLTSNREGSYSEFGKTCCNDLYEFEYPIDLLEVPSTLAQKTSGSKAEIDLLYKHLVNLLPLTLYFHNDEPDPKTTKSFTLKDYRTCYYDYYAVKSNYDKVNATESDEIFANYVQPGFDKLTRYVEITKELMALGARVELDIRGYASPLAKNNYNINLTSRRIESLLNYLKAYDNGSLSQYVNSSNSAGILIHKLPFGEEKSAAGVSDNYYDQNKSVYSLAAAKERRIEIVATRIIEAKTAEPAAEKMVENTAVNQPINTIKSNQPESGSSFQPKDQRDSSKQATDPVLALNQESAASNTTTEINTKPIKEEPIKPANPVVSKKGDEVGDEIFLTNRINLELGKIKRGQQYVKKIRFRNTYGRNITMTRVVADCKCTGINVPNRTLVPDEETEFTLVYDTRGKIGLQEGEVTIFTKEIDGQITIKFTIEVVP